MGGTHIYTQTHTHTLHIFFYIPFASFPFGFFFSVSYTGITGSSKTHYDCFICKNTMHIVKGTNKTKPCYPNTKNYQTDWIWTVLCISCSCFAILGLLIWHCVLCFTLWLIAFALSYAFAIRGSWSIFSSNHHTHSHKHKHTLTFREANIHKYINTFWKWASETHVYYLTLSSIVRLHFHFIHVYSLHSTHRVSFQCMDKNHFKLDANSLLKHCVAVSFFSNFCSEFKRSRVFWFSVFFLFSYLFVCIDAAVATLIQIFGKFALKAYTDTNTYTQYRSYDSYDCIQIQRIYRAIANQPFPYRRNDVYSVDV